MPFLKPPLTSLAGVMSGLIGANNKFGEQFGNPDPKMQGISISITIHVDIFPGRLR